MGYRRPFEGNVSWAQALVGLSLGRSGVAHPNAAAKVGQDVAKARRGDGTSG